MAQLLPLLSTYHFYKHRSYHIKIVEIVSDTALLKETYLPPVCIQRPAEGDVQQPKQTEGRGLNSPYYLDTHHSPNKFIHIPPLLRDLPGNLICPYRIVIRLFAKSKVVTQVDQGQGDPKPHAEQGHHGRERHLESHQESQK